MAQHLRPLNPDRSPMDALGAELRRLRIGKGLSQAELGALVGHSGALVGRIEKAERHPTFEFCRRLDAALDAGGALIRMRPDRGPRDAQRRRVEQLADALVAAGVVLGGTDLCHVDRVAAAGCGVVDAVTGWLGRVGPTIDG